jgi:hypothetical protein
VFLVYSFGQCSGASGRGGRLVDIKFNRDLRIVVLQSVTMNDIAPRDDRLSSLTSTILPRPGV